MFSCSRAALLVTFLVLWTLSEALRRMGEGQQQLHAHQDSIDFATSDLAKSILSLLIWFVSQRFQGALSIVSQLPTCGVPTQEHGRGFPGTSGGSSECCSRRSMVTLTLGSVQSTFSILIVGLVYSLRAYIDVKTREFVDPFTLSLAFPTVILGILVILGIISWRNFPPAYWHASLLQFSGLFITRDAHIDSTFLPYSLLAAFSLCNAIWISLVNLLHRPSSIYLINTAIFAQSCTFHFLLSLFYGSHSISSHRDRFVLALQPLPFLDATKDVLAVFIIQQYGAISLRFLASLASIFLISVDTWKLIEAPDSAFLGCLIAILGCGIFIFCGTYADEQQCDRPASARRFFAAAMICLAALGYNMVVLSQNPVTYSSDVVSEWRTESRSDCHIPESSTLTHTQTVANYTHFNNVLLVVFFSHARYDANLDFHREVYGDYFSNIVYVGPATREDKGFAHSYDVLVDSFQSEENLSDPLFYRMSGRMAHHMLYTALRGYDCYEGYLWVPFDTLLNIPRLQQFNQSLFWYHSPWGLPVSNPALGDFTEPVLNVSRHAPPAMISPDTSINLTETWRGWGSDWWWGDPHVGVSVCMNAFHKVPEDMRTHLAGRTNGQTRLIGGSADTLYIPGRHRRAFMNVLALFLETDCFLEIATPTTVHLVVPPGEPIQFVDHWWIWQPPFNTSFVRQKWTQGYEVDTFHTFHWGERGEDGIWRGDHHHVADVRRLQRESAERQGLGDVFPANLGPYVDDGAAGD